MIVPNWIWVIHNIIELETIGFFNELEAQWRLDQSSTETVINLNQACMAELIRRCAEPDYTWE